MYTQGTHVIQRKEDTGWTADKYLYKDKYGNFRQYDSNGRLTAYGNRLGTIAALVYDNQTDTKPSGIEDMDGTRVLWFTYDGDGHLIRAYTAGGREVRYDYAGNNLTLVSDALDQETRYTYDGNNLTRSVDAAGRSTIITYNDSDDPIAVKDAQGNGHLFEYDYDKNKKQYYAAVKTTSGRIREVWTNADGETVRVDINGRTVKEVDQDGRNLIFTDEKGNETRTDYDEKENLTRILYPDNTEVNFAYDLRFNKVSQITDPLGRITTFEYDDQGNLVKKVQARDTAQERVLAFTYDDLGRVLTATSPGDADTDETTTTFTYDDNGNLETITDPMGNVTQFLEYDAMGNLIRFADARDNEWTFAYDANGRLISSTTPENHTTSFEYDGANNRTAVINAKLKRFAFEYDDHNNLVKAIDPLDQYTSTLYNTDHLPVEFTDPDGRSSATAYDNEGRVLTATDRAGNVISYTYSEDDTSPAPSSMPVAVTYPTFTRQLTYDTMYRVIEQTDVLDDTTTRTRSYTFDDAGNLATSTDEAGRTTIYTYDALNRLVKTIAPDNGETLRKYDGRDNLIMLRDPNNGIQYFTYDKNNRLVSSAKPMGAVTTYEYGATGNKTAVADPKGQRIEYTWSSENRLTQTRYFSADDHDTPVETIDFTYDSLGNLLTWNNGTESAQYTYDDLGRKRTETVNYGSFSLSYAYTYTASGEIKTFTGPDGNVLTYEYDTGARLAGITIPGAGQTGFSHNSTAWNNPAAMTLPGGARQDYAYDPLMRLNTITASDPGSNPVMTRGYTYDSQGNITTKATEHGDYTYSYDTMDRLATAINPTLPDESYTYDNLGNRITDVKIQGQITYNADNQLESYGSASYDYDDNGNMTRKTNGYEITSFFYNIEDRLEKVENSAGDTVATYGYDPFGRRLWKQVSGTKTYFHYSNQGLIGEYNAQGDELKTYGYKPGSQWTIDPLFMKIGTDYYWYQNDANGTPQKLIASNGLVVWEGRYDSFGNCQVVSNGITNNLRFAGQYFDDETGLHYNLNRYYDPKTGRYLRVDPFGEGLNLYVYCFNNPNGLIDPYGLCAVNKFLSSFNLQQFLKNTTIYSETIALGLTLAGPETWLGAIVFAGISTAAKSIEIGFYSKTPYLDTAVEVIKMLLPIPQQLKYRGIFTEAIAGKIKDTTIDETYKFIKSKK
nr:RHS repeat-associated core domain-containing protein [uncultured Desulfobacter sp.]